MKKLIWLVLLVASSAMAQRAESPKALTVNPGAGWVVLPSNAAVMDIRTWAHVASARTLPSQDARIREVWTMTLSTAGDRQLGLIVVDCDAKAWRSGYAQGELAATDRKWLVGGQDDIALICSDTFGAWPARRTPTPPAFSIAPARPAL